MPKISNKPGDPKRTAQRETYLKQIKRLHQIRKKIQPRVEKAIDRETASQ
jgi:hypothetical protein